MDCCNQEHHEGIGPGSRPEQGHDLAIVGGGSAGFAAALRARELGATVVMINRGAIGGTCVNVGCVPSKAMVRAAEAVHGAARAAERFAGVQASARVIDFAALAAQRDELVAELRAKKYADLVADDPGIRRIDGEARFVSPTELEVAGSRVRADRVLIATGARPSAPPIPGLADSGCLDSTAALALDELPASMIVLGGGWIALELAQLYRRLGAEVTVLQRSARVLSSEDDDVAEALQDELRAEGVKLWTSVVFERVERRADGVAVMARVGGEARRFEARTLLCATGRRPNVEGLDLHRAGVELDARGFVAVDETLRAAPGIYGAGDVIGQPAFVYAAAYEGRLAATNALGDGATARDYTAIPSVVFTDPQVAGVGLNEKQAAAAGIEVDVARLDLDRVPRWLAARDTRGFVKLLRRRGTDELVGARIVAPEGGEPIATAALAIRHGIGVSALANGLTAYLTAAEALRLAAQTFDKDVAKLSCCA